MTTSDSSKLPPPQPPPPDNEQQQLEKIAKLNLLAKSILLRHSVLLMSIFAVVAILLALRAQKKALKSPTRFTVETELIYQPKTAEHFSPVGNDAVMQLLQRRNILTQTEEMMTSKGYPPLTGSDLSIVSERNRSHIFHITATGNTSAEATIKANTFAQFCIAEYNDYRLKDLNRWTEVFTQQRRDNADKLNNCVKEAIQISEGIGIKNPEAEQQRLTILLGTKGSFLEHLIAKQTNLEERLEELKEKSKALPTEEVLNYASRISDYQTRLEELDRMILVQEQVYTRQNPKLKAIIDQRAELDFSYKIFLFDKILNDHVSAEKIRRRQRLWTEAHLRELEEGVSEETPASADQAMQKAEQERRLREEEDDENFIIKEKLARVTPELLVKAETVAKSIETLKTELDNVKADRKNTEKEITNSNEQIRRIVALLPKIAQFVSMQDSFRQGISASDLALADLQYLKRTANKELQQIDIATRSTQEPIFSKKAIVVILLGPIILMGSCAFAILLYEFLFGYVRNYSELDGYFGLQPIGMLPVRSSAYMPNSPTGRYAFNEIYYKFLAISEDIRSVFAVQFPGLAFPPGFQQILTWHFASSGQRLLVIHIVAARNFQETDTMNLMNAVFYEDDIGYLPVENPETLSNAERRLLTEDMKQLEEEYDFIIITNDDPINTHGLIFSQMLRIVDRSVVLMRAKRTKRALLRFFTNLHLQGRNEKLLAVMLTPRADRVFPHADPPPRKNTTALAKTAATLGLAVLPVLFGTGCYNRYTENFMEYPLLQESRSAILDQSGLSEEDRRIQEERLRAMEDEATEDYRINAGDKISVNVYGHPDLSTETVVTPDGYIGVVSAGQIKVRNLTMRQAADAIAKALKRFIQNPVVGVTPYEITSQSAAIIGAVQRPGLYTISDDMRLVDIYAKAGGSSIRYFDGQDLEAADLTNAMFFRNGKRVSEVNFRKAIEQGDRLHNVRLKKGDYIFIPARSESMVCLIGAVNLPHKRLWDPNLGLVELLATGGYLKEVYWPYVIIIRGGINDPKMYRVDMDAILQGRATNVMLEAGDIVYVPQDDISEYNVFIRKILPTPQIFSTLFGQTIMSMGGAGGTSP